MYKQRLARLPTVFMRRPVYFVTFCTAQRRALLDRPEIHHAFVAFCRHAVDLGAHVGRYVIMPDHVHLFVTVRCEDLSLSLWLKSLKNSLSKVLREMQIAPPHWQKGFFDHVLRGHESYEQKWGYVVENPVRAGLITRATDWPFQGIISDLTVSDLRRS